MKKLNREEALIAMIQGNEVTRLGWNINDFLFFDTSDFKFKDDGGNEAENHLRFKDGYYIKK